MAAVKRQRTKYPGVFYREVSRLGGPGLEKVYYVLFKRDGKLIESKVGRQYADDMTPARAAAIRSEMVEGKRTTRKEDRESSKIAQKEALWTILTLWEEYKRRNPNLKGIITDQNRFDTHLCYIKNLQPKDLTTTIVDDLRLGLEREGKKPATIRNVLELLRRIVSFGVKKGLIQPLSPSQLHFEMPRLDNEKTEDLRPDQLSALLKILSTTRHKKVAKMMKLALYTGMRRGEIFNLKWEHVDWEHGFINIVGAGDGRGAKSGKSERIPLNDSARDLLLDVPKHSEYIFPGKRGGRLVDIRRQADAIKLEAGLPDDFRPFHGLRHVYASILASSGKVSMYELQKLLTHKSSTMTQRYAHLRDDALKKAADVAKDAIDEAFVCFGMDNNPKNNDNG